MKILDAQMETGTPYILYKDAANNKSNQKNLGTIKSSNLCAEILEYTSVDEVAVCNLASIALPKFLKYDNTLDNTDIIMYTKSNCNFCAYAKKLLLFKYKLKSYKEIIYDDKIKRQKFYNELGKQQTECNRLYELVNKLRTTI